MKLRTTHNSIRIRVRKSELERLRQDEAIEESIVFPNNSAFKFALVIEDIDQDLSAALQDNYLKLSIAKATAKQWINTSKVGIESTITLPKGEALHLLVEKDFPCLDRENEDKLDTFWELASDNKPDNC